MTLDDVTLAIDNIKEDIMFNEKLRRLVSDSPFPILQLDCDNIYYNALI